MPKRGEKVLAPNVLPLAGTVVLLMHTAGCVGAVQSAAAEAPRVATPVVIDETLKAFEGETNRQRVAAIVATPEMQQAIAELGSAFGDGAAANLADETAQAHVEEFAERLTGVISRAMTAGLLTAASQGAMQDTIRGLVATATEQATRTLALEITTTLAPAIRAAVADGLRSPDMNDALRETTRTLSRETVVATHGAVDEMHKEQTGQTLRDRIMKALARTWIVAFLLGAFSLALLIALLALRSRTARYKRERESVAALLRRTIKAAEGKPWSAEMLELLSEHFHADA
jgi:hypothetical protein